MCTSVSRKIWSGQTIGSDEAIPAAQALRMFTINAAYNGFEERIKGSIEPGKLADLAVLAQDPLSIEPEKIKDIPVEMTIVDGKIAFVHEQATGLRAETNVARNRTPRKAVRAPARPLSFPPPLRGRVGWGVSHSAAPWSPSHARRRASRGVGSLLLLPRTRRRPA